MKLTTDFLDETAPPRYTDRILAYLDVLGWSRLIEESARRKGSGLGVIGALNSLLFAPITLVDATKSKLRRGPAMRATHFSDTVVISAPTKSKEAHDVAAYAGVVSWLLLMDGHLSRGALVRGKLHHDDQVIFGPALHEAHSIERDVAKYPRIVVTEGSKGYATYPGVCRMRPDHDGLNYLDYLSPQPAWALRSAREEVAHRYSQTNHEDLNIAVKYRWIFDRLREALRPRKRRRLPNSRP